MLARILATPRKIPFETRKSYARKITIMIEEEIWNADTHANLKTTDVSIISDEYGTPKYILMKFDRK